MLWRHPKSSLSFISLGGLIIMLCGVLLSACGRPALDTLNDNQQVKFTENLNQGGYLHGDQLAFETIQQSWKQDQDVIETELLLPKGIKRGPLVIYMPGLGEPANAGKVWRESWVKAGYAVFSFQSLAIANALQDINARYPRKPEQSDDEDTETDDTSIEQGLAPGNWFANSKEKPSIAGRNSELRYLGHQFFAADALQNRLNQWVWVVNQLLLRHADSFDRSKIILAGYDLGAQTAAALAGEDVEGVKAVVLPIKPMAVIAISPSVNLAKGHVNSRFQMITTPLLVISGGDDNDPYAISSSSTRQLLWQYSASGNKYFLTLDRAGHRFFAGDDWGGRLSFFVQRSFARMEGSPGHDKPRVMAHANSHNESLVEWLGKTKNPYQDLGYKHTAAVVSVSVAYMDAWIKNDEFARFWLIDKANHWLKPNAELKWR